MALLLRHLLLVLLSSLALSHCPSLCNGRGTCDPFSRCTCQPGYEGWACERLTCPSGPAYAAKASTDPAVSVHGAVLTCSGRGRCNGATGRCVCLTGFGGNACEHITCPAGLAASTSSAVSASASFSTPSPVCSGRGACLPVPALQAQALAAGLTPLPPAVRYANWEAPRAYACLCDRGYGGADCSQALCPRGDYALTTGQQRTALVITVDASAIGDVAPNPPHAPPPALYLAFNGATTTLPVPLPSLTSDNCAAHFFGDGRLGIDAGASSCRVARSGAPSAFPGGAVAAGALEITLALAYAPGAAPPPANNAFEHSGSPPLAAFACVLDPSLPPALLAGITCSLALADVQGVALAGAPGGGGATALPPGVTYLLTIDSDAAPGAAGLASVTPIRVAPGNPPTSLAFPSQPLSPTPALMGDAADALYVSFAALAGHTRGATWVIGAPPAATLNASGSAAVRVLSAPGYREYAPCALAGVCSPLTGFCACFPGFFGPACEGSGVQTATPNAPIHTVYAPALDYAGDVLAIVSQRPLGSREFNYFTAGSAGAAAPALALRGDGVLVGAGALFSAGAGVDGGLSAALSDGAAAALAGSGAASGSGSVSALGVSALSVHYGSASVPPAARGGLAAFTSSFPTSAAAAAPLALLRVAAPYDTGGALQQLFAIGGDGRVSVGDIDAAAAAGAAVAAAGVGSGVGLMPPNTGLNIAGGASLVGARGLDVVGGGGVRVDGGGLFVGGGASSLINSASGGGGAAPGAAQHYIGGDVTLNGTLTLTGGGTLVFGQPSPGGLVINDALRVIYDTTLQGPLTAAAGVAVQSGGVTVALGGAHVQNGGVAIDSGGLSMYQGNLVVGSGAASVLGYGLTATNAPNDGVSVATVGAILAGGGLGGGCAASFYSPTAAGFSGALVRIEAESPLNTGAGTPFNLLELVSRPQVGAPGVDAGDRVVFDKFGDLRSSSNLVIATEDGPARVGGRGDAPSISLLGGAGGVASDGTGTYGSGGSVAAVGGDSYAAEGGYVALRGGSGGAGGGAVVIQGGTGGGAGGGGSGGSVVLRPGGFGGTVVGGGAGPVGDIVMQDAAGVARLTVSGNGDLLLSPASGVATSFASASPILTTAPFVSVVGASGAAVLGGDGGSGGGGGSVSLGGGEGGLGGAGGGVAIFGGAAPSGGAAGGVSHFSAVNFAPSPPGASPHRLRSALDDGALRYYSDNGEALGGVTWGAVPGASFTSFAGGGGVGGAWSIGGGGAVGGTLRVGGGADFAGGAVFTGSGAGAGIALTGGDAGIAVASGLVSAGGGLYAYSLAGGEGGVAAAGGGLSIGGGATQLLGETSIFGARLAVAGDVLASGALSAGAGSETVGLARVVGALSVEGNGYFTGPVTSLDTGVFKLFGSMSVGGSMSVAGVLDCSGPVLLEPTSGLQFSPGSTVTGSTVITLDGASALSLGGGSTFAGDAGFLGRLTVGSGFASTGDAVFYGSTGAQGPFTAHATLTAMNDAVVAGSALVSGGIVGGGIVSALGGALVGGPLSLVNSGLHGLVGAPLLLRSSDQFDAGSAAADISLLGGAAQDGNGGNVVLQGGRMGGDHAQGAVILQDASGGGAAVVSVAGSAITLSAPGAGAGAPGMVSISPLAAVGGLLSVTGGSSLMGDVTIGGALSIAGGGGGACAGDFAAGTLTQTRSGAGGALSYAGVLGGSGWYDPSMLRVCRGGDWGLGGPCYGLFSEAPDTPGVHVLMYFNFDAASHDVLYGAASPLWIPVAPGAVFPVYVSSSRRRSLAADFPHLLPKE